ncbi:MAG: phenylacetate--CoA ligase family protein [Devosia sp.]
MRLLDVARGAYVRSPAAVRRSLAPLVSLVPTRVKFGGTYKQWRDLIARSEADNSFARDRHLAGLRGLLAQAHAKSSFYRRMIEGVFGTDFDPTSVTPEQLQRLPVLRKADLAAAGDDVLIVPKAQLDEGYTSGSNGERPFAFYLDKDRSVREFAFVNHVWGRAGYAEGEPKAVLRGFRLPTFFGKVYEWEPALRELRISVFPMTEEDVSLYIDLIDKHQIRYLYGYPSAIEVMCKHMLRLKRKPRLPLKGILPISEPLFPHQRRVLREVFPEAAVVMFYGLSEKAIFAVEVPGEPDVYEFEPLYGCAELVDEGGQPITEIGKEGRLIGTGFVSTGMPFIRYDTEDRARLVAPATQENGYRLRVQAITPRRKPAFLIGSDGTRLVTTDFTPEHPVFFSGIDEYQFYQEEPGKCTIKYIAGTTGTRADAERVRSALEFKAEGKIAFDLQQVERLVVGTSGKRAFIDQRIDLSRH